MAKPTKYDTSHDEAWKAELNKALYAIKPDQWGAAILSAWNGFLRIWEAAQDVRLHCTDLYVHGDAVREFLGKLDRQMVLNLPAPVVATLEGRCGK